MKILVFDDTELHRRAAEVLLAGHDLTVVGNYDEAEGALEVRVDEEKAFALFEKTKGTDADWINARAVSVVYRPDFDVLLTDVLVPASQKAQGPKGQKYVGEEMSLGPTLALRALGAGIKKVGVVTDMNHHDHPASAAFDGFPQISIGDVRVICTNRAITCVDAETLQRVGDEFLDSEEGRRKYPVNRGYGRDGIIYVKAWDDVLSQLLSEKVEE